MTRARQAVLHIALRCNSQKISRGIICRGIHGFGDYWISHIWFTHEQKAEDFGYIRVLSSIREIHSRPEPSRSLDYRSNTEAADSAQLRCNIASSTIPFGDVMKRIATFMLLVVLSVAAAIPAQAQRISPQENARQSRKAIKHQQRMLNKANKKQSKAMKKAAKALRKATRKANRRRR
jgi:hypothetical protein